MADLAHRKRLIRRNTAIRTPKIGAGFTGAGMIVKDPIFDQYVMDHVTGDKLVQAVAAIVMFLIGYRAWRRGAGQVRAEASPS